MSGRLGAKMNGGLGILHHSQGKSRGAKSNPGIRIWALLRIVGGDTTPICVERVLCPVASGSFGCTSGNAWAAAKRSARGRSKFRINPNMKSRGELLGSRAAAQNGGVPQDGLLCLAYRVADHRGAHQVSNLSTFATLLIFGMDPS